MANRYWVGNGGNWNDTAHWSTTTGGASGSSVPTSADNVYFDANSFTISSQTVTVNVAVNCLDMDWTGALNTPTLSGGSQSVSIYGNLTTIAAMTWNVPFGTTFKATTTGKTITTNGLSINGFVIFDGIGGGWTLQDNLVISGNFNLNNGAINTGNKNINCALFNTNNTTTTRSITFGSSTVTCSGNWTTNVTTGLTLDMGTSTIKMTGNTKTFDGGGLTYNNVELQGTPITLTGSNTFNTLTIATGKTVKLTSGTTQTVTSLVCNGTNASPSTLQSVTAGSAATIALPAKAHIIRRTSVKDITVTGAIAVTDIAGTNVSGNTGITFVTKFEMGRIKNDGSFNWYNTTTGTVTKVSG